MAIKENVLRKNLVTNQIDKGQVDPIFEAENLAGNIIEEYPFVEITEDDKDYASLKLAKVKQDKISEIKAARDTLVISDITTSKGLVFSADSDAQFNIFAALVNWDANLMAQGLDPATTQYPWGSTGLISKTDLQEAYMLIMMRKAKVLGVEAPALENQVNACTSVDDVLDKKGNVTAKGVNGIEVKF